MDGKPLFPPFRPPCLLQTRCISPPLIPRLPNFLHSKPRKQLGSQICSVFQVFNGYFVHFFAPDNMDPIPKNILFVIDVSGSMWGIKMKQVSPPLGGSSMWDSLPSLVPSQQCNHSMPAYPLGLVSVSLGCCDKVPHPEWLINNRNSFQNSPF